MMSVEQVPLHPPSVNPLYVFAFLQTFIDILREYFGQISAETLKDNFDVVYQVRVARHYVCYT